MAPKQIKMIIVLVVFVSLTFKAMSAQEANHFIYNGFDGTKLNLSGIAKVQENGLLELTNTAKHQLGRAFFPFPINSQHPLSFSTNFVFSMVPEMPAYGGHGIAFVFAPSTDFPGAIGTQFLGLFNSTTKNTSSSNHILVIELDSIQSYDLDDTDANHVGIDVNGLASTAVAPVGYFVEKEGKNESLQLISGNPMQVWIDYEDPEKLLNVTIAPAGISKPKKPLLSASVNLSQVFLDSMYVGFSASTGSVASHQYILGWSFNRSGPAENVDISKLPQLPKPKEKPNLRILLPLVTIVMFALFILGALYLVRRKKYAQVCEEWEKQYGPQRFSYEVLHKATKGFKDKELLGSGGFGRVYKGVLPASNTPVAIKKVSHENKRTMKEFVAEIASMGRLRQKNLVQLHGYCRRKGELLLVYDYMPNGSLDKFLFTKEKPNLNWAQRFQVIKGVASGLLYLHEEWEQVVLHRDIKASNVLLDADFNARLGDFGLAKFYNQESEDPETTCMVGTVGYIAPELTMTGRPSTSTDVFAFGIFMLETTCARKPFEPQRVPEEVILADWVFESWKKGSIRSTCDPRLIGNYEVEEMELVLKLGLLCTHPTPSIRPTMRQIIQYLDKNVPLPDVVPKRSNTGPFDIGYETSADFGLFSPVSHDSCSVHSHSSTDVILDIGQMI